MSSVTGLVSSKRRLQVPPYLRAIPKFKQIDLACPMWRYPFGSGGKRVATRPPCFWLRTSSATMSSMKFGAASSERVDSALESVVSAIETAEHASGGLVRQQSRAILGFALVA